MKIGITGHRTFDDKATMNYQERNVATWMDQIASKYPDATIITGGATGIDMIAAENALTNNLHSKVILPMHPRTFSDNWKKSNQKRLASILLSSEVEVIGKEHNWVGKFNPDVQTPAEFFVSIPRRPERERPPSFYHYGRYEYETLQERNQAIVDQSQILLAFWDGRAKGGTYNCLKYALTKPDDEITIINGITQETIHSETPIAEYFQTDEACIEGMENLQAKIGYRKYCEFFLNADYFSDNSTVFEIHEIINDAEIDTGVAARVYASVSSKNPMIQKQDAKAAADLIVKFGIEHERYWITELKSNYNKALAELKHLTDALADCETPDTDAMMMKNFLNCPADAGQISSIHQEVENPDSFGDDGVQPATYGFHRINDDHITSPELPRQTRKPTKAELKRNPKLAGADINYMTGKVVKPDPRMQAKNALLAQIRELSGKQLLTFGRNLHHQKANYPELKYTDWTEIWNTYNDCKRNANITSENGFRGTVRPHPDYPQVRRGKQLWAVQFPSGNWEFAQERFESEENRATLQLIIWNRLHADADGTPFAIRNKQTIDFAKPIDTCPRINRDGKSISMFSEPEQQEIKAWFRQEIQEMMIDNPFAVIEHLNETFASNYQLVKNFDDAPNWILERVQGNILVEKPATRTPEPEQEPIFVGREFFTAPLEIIECFPKEYTVILCSEKPIETQIDYRTDSKNPIIISGHDDVRQQAREFLLANGAKEIIAPNRPEEQQRFRMKYCTKDFRLIHQ